MKKKTICSFIACLAIMLISLGLTSNFVHAEDKPEYQLTITPTRLYFDEMEPGTTYTDKFKVQNSGKQDFSYKISFVPYSVTGENYEPNYTQETQYTDIAKWISIDGVTGTLSAGTEREVEYTITVPENSHGGAQAAAIIITMDNPDTSSNGTAVEAIQQLAYIIYGNVDGETVKAGQIIENKVPSLLLHPPIYSTSLVENTGNIYVEATYKLQIFPLFDDEEVFTNEENVDRDIIFPDTKRFHQISWEGAPQLGIFKVRQTVTIFDQEDTIEKIVFIFPLWFIFICLLALFIIIFSIINHIRNRNKE